MIYDCFTFFNELDLLEIRLNILDGVVDKFVLVEATKTFSNIDKPLYFNENKERFKKFEDKIIHIIVDDYPVFETAWTYDWHQRNCIARGLVNCKLDDVILVSDLDEIPDPSKIIEYKDYPGVKVFKQRMFYYFLNNLDRKRPYWTD
ncbi:MAG: N-acetylglucosaminyltransferase, partial [Patescibacteria group bacterium]